MPIARQAQWQESGPYESQCKDLTDPLDLRPLQRALAPLLTHLCGLLAQWAAVPVSAHATGREHTKRPQLPRRTAMGPSLRKENVLTLLLEGKR